jgi:hypothetical protein
VFVREQVTVTWYLYLDRIRRTTCSRSAQPRTGCFWSEDVPSTHRRGRLAFTDEVQGGQRYQVATAVQKALFPLAPGKLTRHAHGAQVVPGRLYSGGRCARAAQVGSGSRSRPIALPSRAGSRPASRPPTVGHYTLEAPPTAPSSPSVNAVTITVSARGTGNVRNVVLPGACRRCRVEGL